LIEQAESHDLLQSAFKICIRPIVVRRTNIEQISPKMHLDTVTYGGKREATEDFCSNADLSCDEPPRSPWHVDCIA